MTLTVAQIVQAAARGAVMALRRGVLMLEPTDGAWANDNNWGDQKVAPLPQTAGQVVQVLPKNARMYGPPHVHSVALTRNDEVNAGNADVYAQFKVGCGGIQNVFLTDWIHGLQLSLVCNSVSVEAVSYAPSANFSYSASTGTVSLGVMVAKGASNPSRCPATFTAPAFAIAEANRVNYDVPDFAREFTAHLFYQGGGQNDDPAVPTGVLISFFAKGGIGLAQYDAQVCAGGRSIPIPGGTNQVQVFNTLGTGHTVNTTAQFFLGF